MLKKLLYVEGSGRAVTLVGTLFFAIVLGVNFYFIDSFMYPSAYRVILRSVFMVLVPATLLPAVIWLSLKISLFKSWKNILMHLVFSLIYVSLFLIILQTILLISYGENILNQPLESIITILQRQLLVSGSMAFLLYWGIVVLSGIQKYYKDISELTERNNQLETQLSHATLSTLKAQLKPHFLFNTLNMVDFLIHTDSEKAIDTIDKLEDLIKSTFDQNQPNACTLKAEIKFLQKYLDIEKARFPDRLSVKLDVEEGTEDVNIPCYLIQPLVENSIKHGVGKTLKKCTITISARFKGDFLIIDVIDDGNGVTKKPLKENWSIGLRNIDERLKLYFGSDALLDVGIPADEGFRSSIIIPRKYLNRGTI